LNYMSYMKDVNDMRKREQQKLEQRYRR
jgi:hypothetical protein